jgi:two-component system C4-dicarboxylate transport sensor histidine kinase DctB
VEADDYVLPSIAHEINNVVALMRFNVDSLKPGLDDEALARSRDTLLGLLERITSITRGLHGLTRSGLPRTCEDIALAKLVRGTIAVVRVRFEARGVTIDTRLDDSVVVEGASSQIVQIIVNLLLNAAEAVEKSIVRLVEVTLTSSGSEAELRVRDSGPPLGAAVRANLFRPFFTTKDAGNGNGLGLAISRRLAETHNGTLTYDERGPGTQFVLRLPLKKLSIGT